ncbi:hypothetical protein MgSA37_00360 [Mucilaginibacter gotjawali]|nr:hypothetical protein MgSA37_00360 [Mucilaginibacter gotjawali]
MSHLKKIIHNCKQATYLIEKKSIKRLSFREAIELRIHLFGCSFCRIFQKQSHIINKLVKELFKSAMQAKPGLDDSFKKELQEKIEEELKK